MTTQGFKRLALPIVGLATLLLASCREPSETQVVAQQSADSVENAVDARVPYTDICVRAQTNRIPVIMFHDVTGQTPKDPVWFDCSAKQFESMMDSFKEQGFQPISLDTLYNHLTKGAPAPDKAVVLTFDDNYQGFYDNALPILKKYNFPAAMFVHTDFVGSKQGRPKMDWPTLQELSKEGLVTIGSHTLSHPADITALPGSEQEHEIVESKKVLEQHLGRTVDYFAYPDGKNDATTQSIVKAAGYKMAFSTHYGPAEESPNIYAVNRYVQTKLDQALEDRATALSEAPAAVYEATIKNEPITYETSSPAGIDMTFIKGGFPSSRRSQAREGVLDFVREAGASAGINGTFFAMAAVSGTSNEMVGPCYASNEREWVPDNVPERLEKIRNRPMIVWGPKKLAIFTFQGGQMNSPDPIKDFMPDFTDAFVAGAWIVHDGQARTQSEMETYGASDLMDTRKRAFVGIMADGTMVLGASKGSVASDQLARAAAAAGVQEAVMMDSGFSTSLVYGDKVVASGHSTPTDPSRPVPHAIVLTGTLATDPNSIVIPQPDVEPAKPTHRRTRHKAQADDPQRVPPVDAVAPDPAPADDTPPNEVPASDSPTPP